MDVTDLDFKGLLVLLFPFDADSTWHGSATSHLENAGAVGGNTYSAQDRSCRAKIFDISRASFENSFSPALTQSSGTAMQDSFKSYDPALQYRLYRVISDDISPKQDQSPSNVVLFVSMSPGAGLTEEEFHNWYEKEHTPMFARIPGWRRTRRAKLVTTSGNIDTISQYLALHEWESTDSFNTPQYHDAISTEWRTRVVEMADKQTRERIVLDLDTDLLVED